MPIHKTADILRAKAEGKVGIILGWQNTLAIESNIDMLHVFRDLGVRIMQLTYNTQNLVGSGCWSRKTAACRTSAATLWTRWKLGIVVDLSHVGEKTAADAIDHSAVPSLFHPCHTAQPQAIFVATNPTT